MIENLNTNGWTITRSPSAREADIRTSISEICNELGEIVPGRSRYAIEEVLPARTDSAKPSSLSSRYGLAPLPLHNDAAHWTVPCRYLTLACVDPGPTPAPTCLLDREKMGLTNREESVCRSAVFAVLNGRSSFYGSVLAVDRPFIRFDPGCMFPVSSDGESVLDIFQVEHHTEVIHHHDWTAGDILVIDNWRVLHGRGVHGSTEAGRILLRAMVR